MMNKSLFTTPSATFLFCIGPHKTLAIGYGHLSTENEPLMAANQIRPFDMATLAWPARDKATHPRWRKTRQTTNSKEMNRRATKADVVIDGSDRFQTKKNSHFFSSSLSLAPLTDASASLSYGRSLTNGHCLFPSLHGQPRNRPRFLPRLFPREIRFQQQQQRQQLRNRLGLERAAGIQPRPSLDQKLGKKTR